MRVLVTRPRFSAARTLEKLTARKHRALLDPVIEIEALPFALPERKISAIAFTSANAVQIASTFDALMKIPVFAVGTRTAEVAREHGFKNVRAAAGDVNALGDLIAAELPSDAQVLHLAGEDRAGDLAATLTQAGIETETLVIYRARAAGGFQAETIEAFRAGNIDAVLHYSERSAAIFVRLADVAGIGSDIIKTRHLCLSSAVAAPLTSLGVRAEIAAAPEETVLLELLGP